MRREEQYHIGMQFKFAEIQQQIPIGLTKKIEAKKTLNLELKVKSQREIKELEKSFDKLKENPALLLQELKNNPDLMRYISEGLK